MSAFFVSFINWHSCPESSLSNIMPRLPAKILRQQPIDFRIEFSRLLHVCCIFVWLDQRKATYIRLLSCHVAFFAPSNPQKQQNTPCKPQCVAFAAFMLPKMQHAAPFILLWLLFTSHAAANPFGEAFCQSFFLLLPPAQAAAPSPQPAPSVGASVCQGAMKPLGIDCIYSTGKQASVTYSSGFWVCAGLT